MRALKLGVAIAACLVSAAAAQQAVQVYQPLGYQQISPTPAATALTVPAGTRMAYICVETNSVRYRDDGTNPTTTVGMVVAAGACITYSGQLSVIRFVQVTSPAILDISYYR